MQKAPYNAPIGFDWVVALTSFRQTGQFLDLDASTISGKTYPIRLSRISDNVWRYTVFPQPSADSALSPVDCHLLESPRSVSVDQTQERLTATGPNSSVRIIKNPWNLSFISRSGEELLRENQADVDGLGRPFVLPLGGVETDGVVCRFTQSFYLHPDEALFGLGEKFTPLNKKGQKIDGWNVDALGSTSERSHKNIPLLLSTRGYGIYIHSGARITWELGTQSCQSFTFCVEDTSLDVFVIVDPTLSGLLRHYADLTGHAPVPPKWSFGLWVSSGGTYRDEKTMNELVDGLEKHDLPADVVHIDPWWMKWRSYCDFQWDRVAFPHVEQFIGKLNARQLHICLWEHPYISVESKLFDVGTQRRYFVKRPDGTDYVIQYGLSLAPRPDGIVRESTPENSWNAPVAIIDLTNPEAYRWFQDLHRPILRMGVDVFKTDFGEDIPADAEFYNGKNGSVMHNLYPLLYNQAVFEVTEQEKGRGIVWSRSGTAGNQRYPVCWSGDPAADFESLACTIRGGLSVGLSGIPFWSNDIGGYRGTPSPDLYIRWAQFGLLCSHSRMHGDSPREPWKFGEAAVAIVRRYVRLRSTLFPYLYSCAHEASATGIPVLRAMPLSFQSDINTYDKDLQYLLGPWLLVAPIYTADGARHVYLPEGEWIDFWTLELHHGPKSLWVEAALDTLPLYIKSGAIIPMKREDNRIPDAPIDPMVLEIYPTDHSFYELLEDEGNSRIRCTRSSTGIDISIDSTIRRSWILRFRQIGMNAHVFSQSPDRQPVVPRVAYDDSLHALEISLDALAAASVKIDFD